MYCTGVERGKNAKTTEMETNKKIKILVNSNILFNLLRTVFRTLRYYFYRYPTTIVNNVFRMYIIRWFRIKNKNVLILKLDEFLFFFN